MPRTLSDDDLIEVLEQIIPESKNSAARIAAVRALRELDAGETPSGAVADLYAMTPRLQPRARRQPR